MYSQRSYRSLHKTDKMAFFKVNIRETDLWIAVDGKNYYPRLEQEVEQLVFTLRTQLEEYIKINKDFFVSLTPCLINDNCPPVAKSMIMASTAFGVGPMAAVAGTFSEYVGDFLSTRCKEVIVENGGDIYIKTQNPKTVAIFAGNSPFSNRIGIQIPGNVTRGICTSSGTVGPSLSLGNSDATVVIAKTPSVADAAATMLGNMIQKEEDVERAINTAKDLKGLLGTIIIKNDKMGISGEVEIVPIDN